MLAFLYGLGIWHWIGLSVVLLILELLTGGGFLLWIAISAAIVAVCLLVVPALGWPFQFLIFALGAIISCVAWWKYLQRHPQLSDRPLLNQRGRQYIGRVFTLDEPIVNYRGRINVDDSTWRIKGDDLPVGEKVKVVDTDGVILVVARYEASE